MKFVVEGFPQTDALRRSLPSRVIPAEGPNFAKDWLMPD